MLDNLGKLQRTHSCGELRANNIGQSVTLMGWVAKRRDFGELTFVDLRDREGITQVVFNSQDAPEAHTKAKDLRGEFVTAVSGEVVSRAENTRNPRLATGEIEVHARKLADICEFVYLIDQPYNQASDIPNNIVRVNNWTGIKQHIRDNL